MTLEQMRRQIGEFRKGQKRMFTTSSFQSHSLVLLHILSRIDPTITVLFINTGYHFPETIRFRNEVTALLGLKTIDVKPAVPKSMQRDCEGRLLFATDPDLCCHLNKTQPLRSLLSSYDVWISGIRADQTAHRAAMKVLQPAPHGCLRFHPLLDWSADMIDRYQEEHGLPKHPLEAQGYLSIGCEPCTRKLLPGMRPREARWFGMKKVECGLHTALICHEKA